ncbi:endolytic transglycosylase MltG [Nocardioides ochotonae]|uniref:endolytic transglycosylase MltG n=1 Tax=Nocardioides ochotonae TaxID=2685869 RepID=UPI0014095315|nr:endolytic transglycosylase MltG [Nocardioides ochotonae]
MTDPYDSRDAAPENRETLLSLDVAAHEPAHNQGAHAYVPGGRRRRERSRLPGCLAALVALAVVVGGLYWGVSAGVAKIQSLFGEPEDYPGPGTGQVMFEVAQGDTISQMGRNLKDAGVVASVDAFTDAASANPDSTGIQVGYFELKKEMRAADAVDVLVDPSNIVSAAVTIPEGLRVVDIVEILADKTDFSAGAFEKALVQPGKIGLPDYAKGNPEGYLFPATYAFGPKDKPVDMIRAMVRRWEQAAESAGLLDAAKRLGYTPHELMTIASLVEAEGRGEDMPKIARVIYNRLETEGYPTNGKLEIDATVNYALGRNLGVAISPEDLAVDSPYNTRRYAGLPPGPIEAPGDDAIAAAAAPAEGPWFFYVTVDLRTGETKFTEDYDEFLTFKAEFQEYCKTSDAC